FGVRRWVAMTEGVPQLSFAAWAATDLQALGKIIRRTGTFPAAAGDPSFSDEVNVRMERLLTDLECPSSEMLAREVQGRLGDMLLLISGESIEMVDQRDHQRLSRRSIVDELFDGTESAGTSVGKDTIRQVSVRPHDRPTPASQSLTLPLWLILIAVIVLAILQILVNR
ncbi:MAG: hypothetical protein KDA89_07350, partial [Planctomycetaceae bacterium]|nr:hypothetical protein [Planctomycetaceae bacterium]